MTPPPAEPDPAALARACDRAALAGFDDRETFVERMLIDRGLDLDETAGGAAGTALARIARAAWDARDAHLAQREDPAVPDDHDRLAVALDLLAEDGMIGLLDLECCHTCAADALERAEFDGVGVVYTTRQERATLPDGRLALTLMLTAIPLDALPADLVARARHDPDPPTRDAARDEVERLATDLLRRALVARLDQVGLSVTAEHDDVVEIAVPDWRRRPPLDDRRPPWPAVLDSPEALDRVRAAVFPGLRRPDRIVSEVLRALAVPREQARGVRHEVLVAWEQRRRHVAVTAQRTGPDDPDDSARLRAAFTALTADGVVGRMDFTCCEGCGRVEIRDERGPSREEIGYTFFHAGDTDALAAGSAAGPLTLSVGAFPERSASATAVLALVAARLEQAGLTVVADDTGTPEEPRLRVLVPDWRHPLAGDLPAGV